MRKRMRRKDPPWRLFSHVAVGLFRSEIKDGLKTSCGSKGTRLKLWQENITRFPILFAFWQARTHQVWDIYWTLKAEALEYAREAQRYVSVSGYLMPRALDKLIFLCRREQVLSMKQHFILHYRHYLKCTEKKSSFGFLIIWLHGKGK